MLCGGPAGNRWGKLRDSEVGVKKVKGSIYHVSLFFCGKVTFSVNTRWADLFTSTKNAVWSTSQNRRLPWPRERTSLGSTNNAEYCGRDYLTMVIQISKNQYLLSWPDVDRSGAIGGRPHFSVFGGGGINSHVILNPLSLYVGSDLNRRRTY